jgi:hypothetical protein
MSGFVLHVFFAGFFTQQLAWQEALSPTQYVFVFFTMSVPVQL